MTGACCVTRILYTLHDIASHTTCPPPYRWPEVADQRRGKYRFLIGWEGCGARDQASSHWLRTGR